MLECFAKWQALNIPVFIYSSGSIEAQKLLFQFTERGDLLPYLKGHFDTTIGMKVNTESYTAIFNNIKTQLGGAAPQDTASILFVTGICVPDMLIY